MSKMKRSNIIFATLILVAIAASGFAGSQKPPKGGVNVVYAKVGDRELHINIVLPMAKSDKPLPLVVWIHGGGWAGGNYERNQAARLVGHGFAAASVQYRFSDVAKFPAQIHECKAAIRWLRAHAGEYNIDPNRIGVWGGSAGGHLVSLLGTSDGVKELEGNLGNPDQSSRVQAVVDFFGPTKFLTDKDEDPCVRQLYHLVPLFFGGTPEEKPELYKLGSPITHVTKDDPPFLIVHGDKDPIVPVRQGEVFYDALRHVGVDVTFIKVKNGDHGFTKPDQVPNEETIGRRVVEFFNKHLKG